MKRLIFIAIVTALSLTFSSITYAQTVTIPFTDHEDHDFQEAIEYLYSKGIIQGYPNNTFKPDNLITRAELLKIIIESNFNESDYAEYTTDPCFPDIVAGEWYVKYVCFAKSRGIVQGYPDGTFKPEQNINLVESLKIMYEGIGIVLENEDVIFKFKYYSPAMKAGYIPEVLSGEYDKLVTRAEVSEVIYRILMDDDKVLEEEEILWLAVHAQKYKASCATAALSIALSKQMTISEDEIIDRMTAMGMYPNLPLEHSDNAYVWDDPQQVFVGDINGIVSINMSRLAGFGFLEGPLERLAREWAPNSEEFSHKTLSFVADQVEKGNPVIVFTNVNARDGAVVLNEPGPYTVTWKVRDSGDLITVPMYKHNFVVEGFKGTVANPQIFYVVDPFYGQRMEMTQSELNNIMQGYNFSGVVVKF